MSSEGSNHTNEKPAHSMLQNAVYALTVAAKESPIVLWLMCTMCICSLGYSVVTLFLPKVVIAGVERGTTAGTIVFIIVGFTAIITLVRVIDRYANIYYQNEVIACRTAMVNWSTLKALTTSYSNTDEPDFRKKHEKAREATGGNAQGTEAGYRTITLIVTNICGFIVFFALLTKMNMLVLVAVGVTTIVSFFVRRNINKWEYANEKVPKENRQKLWYIVNIGQDHLAAKDIRIFGVARWLQDLSNDFQALCFHWERRRNVRQLIGDAVNCLMSLGREGIAYGYLLSVAIRGDLSASDFVLYFAAVSGVSSFLSDILSQFAQLYRQMLDVDRVRVFLEYPEPFNFERQSETDICTADQYEFEFRNVSYQYPSASQPTIRNISLTVRAGENLAIVGLNGAGKSTLVKLLCGLYDPTEGQVLLNGKDIREFDRNEYYRIFTAVFQEHSLLPVSILKNIAQTSEEPDEARVAECLRLASLDLKVSSLSEGTNALLVKSVNENSVELSGGETQRLLLARALYKNAPVVVLDEPTAALDPIAESEMYLKYGEFTKGRTSVFISHRLASTRFCDRILVIGKGEIDEIGTHDELLRADGTYANLFHVQSQYYRNDAIEAK